MGRGMKAVFKKVFYITFIIFLILDLIWLSLCVFMVVKKGMTSAGDIFAFSFVTIIFFSFTIILLYNHKAYLHIDDNKIVGKFGFFKRLECNISEVTFVHAQVDTIHIVLKDRKYHIWGIKNAYAVSAFIQQRMPFSPCNVTEEVIENLEKHRQNQKKNIILVFCLYGLTLVWLLVAVLLIGSTKEFSDFTQRDWVIFTILCAMELPTVIIMFVFAIRSGKGNLELEKQTYEIKRSVFETSPILWGPGYLRAVLADSIYSRRITVYCGCVENDPNSTCFRVEILDKKLKLQFLFQSEIFTMGNFDEEFEGLVDITDKLQNKNT